MPAFAQQPAKDNAGAALTRPPSLSAQGFTLTDAEQKEAAAAKGAVEQAAVALNAALNALAEADLSECSRATFVGMNVQLRVSDKRTAEAQRAAVLWKHRAAHACNDCGYSADGKSLAKPEKQ